MEHQSQNETQSLTGERLAQALGWFSIGLGAAELIAPGAVARLIGVRDNERSRSLLQAYGVREIATGLGILSQPRPAAWMWGRVGGDLLDVSTLFAASAAPGADRNRIAGATAAVLSVMALDAFCAQRLGHDVYDESEAADEDAAGVHVTQTITVERSPEEVYAFWHDFENLPRFMKHIETVRPVAEGRTHWRAKGIAGLRASWEAEITDDQPNRLISWRSVGSADVYNAGTVRFERASGERGTVVRVDIRYAPRGGTVGATIAKLFGKAPRQLIENDLRRFKQVMELGEVVHSDASIHRGMHPAQPAEELPQHLTPAAREPVVIPG